MEKEYSACEIRKVLQELFPHRRLVLSQFTFFNQIGVAKANGSSFRRGRRCYLLKDILPIACVLALKEEGIPLKNLGDAPQRIQKNIDKIFNQDISSILMGYGDTISLDISDGEPDQRALNEFLEFGDKKLFWSFDLTSMAAQLQSVITGDYRREQEQATALQVA